jgi:glycosyltransferase involved in cell wall biosynthesis
MNILIANTRHFYGGGDSTYTFNLARLLRSRGHRVAFYAMQGTENLPDDNSDLFVSHIDFKELNTRKSIINGLSVLWRSIYSFEAKKKFNRLLARFKPDIVHLQSIHGHITPSIILEAKKSNIPVIWTLHDYRLFCPNQNMIIDRDYTICEVCSRDSYYHAVLKKCKKNSLLASIAAALEAYGHSILRIRESVTCFISPSKFLRDKFIEKGLHPDKIKHVPNLQPVIKEQNASANDNYILYIGILKPIKGIKTIVGACRSNTDIKLVLAGRAEEQAKNDIISTLPDNAVYVGLKTEKELCTLKQNASAIVLPSLWYENQPYAILEAFAHAKPVIASNIGGMAELVKNKDRGILVKPGDVQGLARAMGQILKNPVRAHIMGQNARDYVVREHGANAHYGRIMSIYGTALQP